MARYEIRDDQGTVLNTVIARDQAAADVLAGAHTAVEVASVPRPKTMEVRVRAEADRRISSLGPQYRPNEKITWAHQEAEARAYLADDTIATPMLDLLKRTDETKAELAAIIVAKADALTAGAAAIIGAQRELLAMSPIPEDFADDSHWP